MVLFHQAYISAREISSSIHLYVEGDCLEAYTASYDFYVQNESGHYFDINGEDKGTQPYAISVDAGQTVTVENLPYGKYTVSENKTRAFRNGYTNDLPDEKTVEVSETATPVANFINSYYNTALTIQKTVTGGNESGPTFTGQP